MHLQASGWAAASATVSETAREPVMAMDLVKVRWEMPQRE
jgi:hypothetical protein